MGYQTENQQQRKPQVPPAAPEAKDDDFKKQGVDPGKKAWTTGKETEKKSDSSSDDADRWPE